MSIDKQKLQSLLWSEVAAWKANCAEWKRNTEALQEFLGEKTVEEVALELLAENEALRDGASFRAIQSLRQDCESLRKDAEVGRLVFQFFDRMDDPAECDPLERSVGEFLAAVSAAMSKVVQP